MLSSITSLVATIPRFSIGDLRIPRGVSPFAAELNSGRWDLYHLVVKLSRQWTLGVLHTRSNKLTLKLMKSSNGGTGEYSVEFGMFSFSYTLTTVHVWRRSMLLSSRSFNIL